MNDHSLMIVADVCRSDSRRSPGDIAGDWPTRGARFATKLYADRITGNCSHQHGTVRMGNGPDTSVRDRWCRAHEVANRYAVDGSPFPTGTGAKPTLTIMANAWRVADKIIAERGASPRVS